MKHNRHTLLIAFALLASFICTTSAHAQIIGVNLQPPPPYQFKIEHFWKVSLMNPTQTTYQVYLVGRATEKKDGRVVEATTMVFSLPPGLKIVTGRELAPLDVKEYNSRYSDVVKNIGTVPSGNIAVGEISIGGKHEAV